MSEPLYRSSTDRVIAGVAGGLAEWAHLDPSLVRVAWVILAILSGGILALVYFVMMIVIPLAPVGWAPYGGAGGRAFAGTAGPGGVPGWQPPEPGSTGSTGPERGAGGWQGPAGGATAEPDKPVAGDPAAGWQDADTTTSWGATPAGGPPPATPTGTPAGAPPAGPPPSWNTAPGWNAPVGWNADPAAARRQRRPRSGNGGVVFGAILVALGLWFLIRPYVAVDWNLIWPIVLVAIGAALIVGAMRRRTP